MVQRERRMAMIDNVETAGSVKSGLTQCKVCGHLLAIEAEVCPNCGLKTVRGREKERRAGTLRELEIKRVEVSRELSTRKTIKFIVLLTCIAGFVYGYYLLNEDY